MFFLREFPGKYCNTTKVGSFRTVASHKSVTWHAQISTSSTIADMRDDFRILPKDTDVSVGEDTVLKCSPPKGHPTPVVRWKKDGTYLDLTSSNR